MKTVYIAGPLTKGNVLTNLHRAKKWANYFMGKGFAPFVPHLYAYLEIMEPKPYEQMMEIDFTFLKKCDFVFRINGESPGADREIALAESLGIPVYYEDKLIDLLKEQGGPS